MDSCQRGDCSWQGGSSKSSEAYLVRCLSSSFEDYEGSFLGPVEQGVIEGVLEGKAGIPLRCGGSDPVMRSFPQRTRFCQLLIPEQLQASVICKLATLSPPVGVYDRMLSVFSPVGLENWKVGKFK